MRVEFTKMQGAGNDYIYFDCRQRELEDVSALAMRLSDRHKGIGGDGIVLITESTRADAGMRMLNADGSEGNMCGNAIRCVAKYLYDRDIVRREEMTIETRSGVKRLFCHAENGVVASVRVDMGPAVFDPRQIPVRLDGDRVVGRRVHVAGGEYAITCVSMGNPHCVVFADPSAIDLSSVGPRFETDALFPARVNTEFVQKIGENALQMRVWERGSGETMACGTGACAAAAAACAVGLCEYGADIRVELRGGTLFVNVGPTVYLTGEAVTVFTGEVDV